MPKPLPTNTGVITDRLLRTATAVQIAVYEFRDGDVDDTVTVAALEKLSKEIDRQVRALRKTI